MYIFKHKWFKKSILSPVGPPIFTLTRACYTSAMKQTTTRIITGLIILAIGVGALLDALQVIQFWGWFGTWWPVILVLTGLITLTADLAKNYIWGIAQIIVGGFLLIKNLGIVDFNIFALIAPVVIIAIGLSILANASGRGKVASASYDSDDVVAVLSGSDVKNKSQAYKGGKITAIFGGVQLDLRDAKIKGEAQLDVFTLCGGVELKVPRDWKVVVKATPIAGGVENKSEGSDDPKAPILTLTGTVALGGVEIKT